MSQKSVKTLTLSSSASSSAKLSSPKPKKSLKRPKPDSSPEIDENDGDSLEVIFDKSSNVLKPSKSKKTKKGNVSSSAESSTVNLSDDEENIPPKPKKHKKKSTNGNDNKEKINKKVNDEDDNSSLLDGVENLLRPPKLKNHKKTLTVNNENSVEHILDDNSEAKIPNTENLPPPKKSHKKKIPDNDGGNSLNVLFDKTKKDGASSKVKKIKKVTPENDADGNPSVSEDVEDLPRPPKLKNHKKTSTMGNENSVERVPDENSETAKSNTENLTPPKKSHKKKIPDNDGGNSLNVLFDKTKNDGPSSKAKKIKKATHENDADVNPSVLEDVKNLPAPPKKSHKKKIPANSDGNSLNFLFDKTKNGAFSDAKKSKKVKASQLPISDNNSPPKSSSKNKNGVTPNSAKKSTQQSIFGFCTHQSPAVSSGNDKVKAKECFDDALKALKKGQHFAFKQAINAAQKLSESSIESIESECFKFAVLKYRRNNIDYDENENYQIYERMLSQFSKNICEDTSILNSKAFPDLKPAIENTQHLNLFGSCLAISQFFASFPIYLETTLKFSAEDLLKAVTSGVEGYHKLTAEILAEFIHTFSTYDWFKGYKFFTSHLRDITWNGTSASEICKLFLLKDISPLTREIKHSLDGKLFDIIKGNKSELEKKLAERNIVIPPFDKCLAEAFIDKEFHELLPKQQILILEYLVDLFMADYFFIRQFEPEECKVIEREKIDAMKKELQELIIKNQTMKRSEKKRENEEKKPDQQYVRKKRNLELQILYAERRYTLNKLNAALKPLPITLGYDRFHRRYYIFQNSPNSGIYIEEFCQISLDDETEFENDSIASELEKFTVESTRIPMKTSQWYRVSTKEELNEIKEILCKKGIRENLLSETIEHNEAAISETLNAEIKPRDLKFNENESELEFLKISMKKVFDKAEKYSLIHFSQTYEDLIAKISGANTFEELRTVIVSCVPSILPCAFEPYAPGVKFFRITSWIQFAGLCQSYSQMHALLLVLFEKIRTDKLFGAIVCPRCDIRFDRIERRGVNSKATIISCNLCYGYIHFKCHFENTEIDPSPTEPSWICEPCKKLDNHNEEDKKNVEEEEDIIDSKPKTVIVGDKVLRATKARERKDTESETASSQTSSRNTVSRNSEWENETTRSLRPRRQGTNYAETSFVEEKSLKSKSKILVLPPQIKVKVKEEIRERYDDFCSDSRILGSLRPVKFEACENSEMTIDLLKSNLHKFKKINQLDAVFQSLREAAILHFKNNVRKFDEIQRHFKEFFGEDDATTDEEEDYQEEENDDNNVEDSDVEEEDDKNNGEDSDVEEAEEKDDE